MKVIKIKKKISIMIVIITILCSTFLINFVNAETEPFQKFTGMYIRTPEVKPGEKVYVDLYMNSDSSTKIKAYGFVNNDWNRYITVEIKDIESPNPYFLLPNNTKSGDKFEITIIEVTDSNGTINYVTNPNGTNAYTNCLGKNSVTVIENETSLKNLAIKGSSKVEKNGKLYLDLETTGKIDLITVHIKNKNIPSAKALLAIQDLKGSPYINLNLKNNSIQKIYEGECYIEDVWINPSSKNYIHYSKTDSDALPLNFDIDFTIIRNQEQSENTNNFEIKLNSLTVSTTSAQKNDKVFVNLSADKQISKAMLSFENSNSENTMIVYLKELNTDKPYFIVPFTTESGTYDLNYAVLYDNDGNNTHFRKESETLEIKHFDFNSTITIDEKKSDINLMSLDNEKITMDIINEIYNINENIVIEINAENNPIIDEALFEAIKDANKTIIIKFENIEWVFNGKDIEQAKTIDVSTNIYKTLNNQDSNISKIVNEGIILDFAENGTLPGKCLIRVQSTDDIETVLNKAKTKIYYYNENENKFDKVKMHSIITEDNYYEFYINHNSKYVMTLAEINDEYVSNNTSQLVLNGESVSNNSESIMPNNVEEKNFLFDNKTLLIQIGVIALCVIILILIGKGKILSNKKNKQNKQ